MTGECLTSHFSCGDKIHSNLQKLLDIFKIRYYNNIINNNNKHSKQQNRPLFQEHCRAPIERHFQSHRRCMGSSTRNDSCPPPLQRVSWQRGKEGGSKERRQRVTHPSGERLEHAAVPIPPALAQMPLKVRSLFARAQ